MLLVLDMVIYLFALFGLFCPWSGIGYFPYGVSFRQLVAVVQMTCGFILLWILPCKMHSVTDSRWQKYAISLTPPNVFHFFWEIFNLKLTFCKVQIAKTSYICCFVFTECHGSFLMKNEE